MTAAMENVCQGCSKELKVGHEALVTLNEGQEHFHIACFKCSTCDLALVESNALLPFYMSNNLPVCSGCVHRCKHCEQIIMGTFVALPNSEGFYHLECFMCSGCGQELDCAKYFRRKRKGISGHGGDSNNDSLACGSTEDSFFCEDCFYAENSESFRDPSIRTLSEKEGESQVAFPSYCSTIHEDDHVEDQYQGNHVVSDFETGITRIKNNLLMTSSPSSYHNHEMDNECVEGESLIDKDEEYGPNYCIPAGESYASILARLRMSEERRMKAESDLEQFQNLIKSTILEVKKTKEEIEKEISRREQAEQSVQCLQENERKLRQSVLEVVKKIKAEFSAKLEQQKRESENYASLNGQVSELMEKRCKLLAELEIFNNQRSAIVQEINLLAERKNDLMQIEMSLKDSVTSKIGFEALRDELAALKQTFANDIGTIQVQNVSLFRDLKSYLASSGTSPNTLHNHSSTETVLESTSTSSKRQFPSLKIQTMKKNNSTSASNSSDGDEKTTLEFLETLMAKAMSPGTAPKKSVSPESDSSSNSLQEVEHEKSSVNSSGCSTPVLNQALASTSLQSVSTPQSSKRKLFFNGFFNRKPLESSSTSLNSPCNSPLNSSTSFLASWSKGSGPKYHDFIDKGEYTQGNINCQYCLDPIDKVSGFFGCKDCKYFCHPRCSAFVPPTCEKLKVNALGAFYNNPKVFGGDLKKTCKREGSTTCIPHLIQACVKKIESGELIESEGIYRITGSISIRNALVSKVETMGDYSAIAECDDIHAVASLLKKFLRELPTPLLSAKIAAKLIKANKVNMSKNERARTCLSIITTLDSPYKEVILYLLKHLKLVSSHESSNKMTPSNLGIVFVPNLFPESNNEILELSGIVAMLIERFDETLI